MYISKEALYYFFALTPQTVLYDIFPYYGVIYKQNINNIVYISRGESEKGLNVYN